MTTAAPEASAPAAPAAAAPAAPSAPAAPAPSAPAWSGGQSVSEFLSGLTNSNAAPVSPAAPAPAAPVVAVKPPEVAAPVVAPPAETVDGAKPPEVAAPVAPASEPKLIFGRFKTEAEAEAAYAASGREGRRLAQLTKDLEAQAKQVAVDRDKFASELENLKMQAELGPEVAEPTPEEMETWSAAKVAKHYADKTKRDITKKQLEDRKISAEKESKAATEDRYNKITGLAKRMAADQENFPHYAEMSPVYDELMDLEGGLIGLPNAPLILYLAAKGHTALQMERASAKKTKESSTTAAAVAAANLPGAGAPGAAPSLAAPGTGPANNQPDPNSDEAHMARILTAGRKLNQPIFGDL